MLSVAAGYGRVEFIGLLPPSKRTIDIWPRCSASHQGHVPPWPCFLSFLHSTVCFVCAFLLHSSLFYLVLDVPSVMPKNVMAITLPSLFSSLSPLYGLIRKPFTVAPVSVHWKLSILHDRNFIFIHLFCYLAYHYLIWLFRGKMTHNKCHILFLHRKTGST